jgi:hypothetical protein
LESTVPKREYDPRHAAQRRIAAAIVACVAVIVLAAVVTYSLIRWPNLGVHKPAAAPAVCRFYSENVTVTLTGAASCTTLFQALADDTDTKWNSTTLTHAGEQFAQLAKGPFTIRVYDMGNRPFAGRVADYFAKMQWRPETLTSPSP